MGVTIQEIRSGLCTFHFNHHLDLQRILKKAPWYFDSHLLVLDFIPKNDNQNYASSLPLKQLIYSTTNHMEEI